MYYPKAPTVGWRNWADDTMPHQRPGGGTEAFIDMCITLLIFFPLFFAMVCFVCFLDCATADIERLTGIDRKCVCRQAALFLLKMKEKNLVTQTAVDELIDRTSFIFDHTFSMLRAGIREKLATSGVDVCLLYTSPSPRDATLSRMPSSA